MGEGVAAEATHREGRRGKHTGPPVEGAPTCRWKHRYSNDCIKAAEDSNRNLEAEARARAQRRHERLRSCSCLDGHLDITSFRRGDFLLGFLKSFEDWFARPLAKEHGEGTSEKDKEE